MDDLVDPSDKLDIGLEVPTRPSSPTVEPQSGEFSFPGICFTLSGNLGIPHTESIASALNNDTPAAVIPQSRQRAKCTGILGEGNQHDANKAQAPAASSKPPIGGPLVETNEFNLGHPTQSMTLLTTTAAGRIAYRSSDVPALDPSAFHPVQAASASKKRKVRLDEEDSVKPTVPSKRPKPRLSPKPKRGRARKAATSRPFSNPEYLFISGGILTPSFQASDADIFQLASSSKRKRDRSEDDSELDRKMKRAKTPGEGSSLRLPRLPFAGIPWPEIFASAHLKMSGSVLTPLQQMMQQQQQESRAVRGTFHPGPGLSTSATIQPMETGVSPDQTLEGAEFDNLAPMTSRRSHSTPSDSACRIAASARGRSDETDRDADGELESPLEIPFMDVEVPQDLLEVEEFADTRSDHDDLEPALSTRAFSRKRKRSGSESEFQPGSESEDAVSSCASSDDPPKKKKRAPGTYHLNSCQWPGGKASVISKRSVAAPTPRTSRRQAGQRSPVDEVPGNLDNIYESVERHVSTAGRIELHNGLPFSSNAPGPSRKCKREDTEPEDLDYQTDNSASSSDLNFSPHVKGKPKQKKRATQRQSQKPYMPRAGIAPGISFHPSTSANPNLECLR
ncbi:hypothetical protein FB451DRAFT_1167090 [Mycena latifolia]|nr:hypothetical protein FB451DRAFT_1167090 [Mycena latifolia]